MFACFGCLGPEAGGELVSAMLARPVLFFNSQLLLFVSPSFGGNTEIVDTARWFRTDGKEASSAVLLKSEAESAVKAVAGRKS